MTDQLPPQPAMPPSVPSQGLPAEEYFSGVPEPKKRRINPLGAGLIGLFAGAGLVGAAWAVTAISDLGTPDTFTLKGNFALTDEVSLDPDGACRGGVGSGFEDIAEGTSVTVYGAKGDVIATGDLGKSKADDSGMICTFKIAVPQVPTGEKFYKVEVSHRGTVQLSAKQAENGELAANLG